MKGLSIFSGVLVLSSFYLLDDDFEDDATFGEFEADVLPCRRDLTQLGHCVKSLLRCYDDTPLAAVLLLKELDKHIRRIVAEAFGSYSCYDVVLAEVFEVLRRILRSLYPERIVLCWLALIRNLSVKQ